MINIRWKNFDSILSQSKGRGYKNFPGGVPPDPQIFQLASLAFGLDCPSLHGRPPCLTIASASLTVQYFFWIMYKKEVWLLSQARGSIKQIFNV